VPAASSSAILFGGDAVNAAPAEAVAANTNTVAQGAAALLNQIQAALLGIDDDGPGHSCPGS
jgi:hypothetical protein